MRRALAEAMKLAGGVGLIGSGFAMTWLYINVGPRAAMMLSPFAVLSVTALVGAECL